MMDFTHENKDSVQRLLQLHLPFRSSTQSLKFFDRINDPTSEPDKKAVSAVSELLLSTAEIHPSKYDALDELFPPISKLMGRYVWG